MELVEKKDSSYFETFFEGDPDLEEAEIAASESDSKFVDGYGWRKTFIIKNSSLDNSKFCSPQ